MQTHKLYEVEVCVPPLFVIEQQTSRGRLFSHTPYHFSFANERLGGAVVCALLISNPRGDPPSNLMKKR
jgi:hypothetical protein